MASEDLEVLLRWEGAGGTWDLIGVLGDCVDIELLTCGRDEVMGRLRSDEADVKAYVSDTNGPGGRGAPTAYDDSEHDPQDSGPRQP